MLIDAFSSRPDFPFERYFESANQYAAAMEYWMAVLRSAEGFEEAEWTARDRPVDLEGDMYLGKVIDITAPKLGKEINLQTWSIPGDANMLFKENSGMSPAEYQEQKALFGPDYKLEDHALEAMSYDAALAEAKEEAAGASSRIWVEKAVVWQADPRHQEGGYDASVERLVVTSQISREGEMAVLRALALFLAPGLALDRINAAFSGGADVE